MPTVMNMRWRGLTPEQYEEARKQVNWEGDTPDGAQFHIAWFEDDGLRVVDLWDSPGDFQAFVDNRLTRRLKEALAFAVSVTSRSPFGTTFHLGEMRRLGVGERGVMEVLGVTQMFSSYTKIADTLQLESDMHDLAPVDWSPAPGGPPTPHAPKA